MAAHQLRDSRLRIIGNATGTTAANPQRIDCRATRYRDRNRPCSRRKQLLSPSARRKGSARLTSPRSLPCRGRACWPDL
eukprot:5416864-Pleurochrysis_carterae.AAC.2